MSAAAANEELARDAGLACDGGIVVDLAARTADPLIHAIGDCTHRPLPLYERMGRLESVPNALEQAKQAAADLCGRPPPAPEVPWFWSDQYRSAAADRRPALRRDRDRAAWRSRLGAVRDLPPGRQRRLLAVEAVNAAPEFMGGRMMIGKRKPIPGSKLRDMSLSMKDLAA